MSAIRSAAEEHSGRPTLINFWMRQPGETLELAKLAT